LTNGGGRGCRFDRPGSREKNETRAESDELSTRVAVRVDRNYFRLKILYAPAGSPSMVSTTR
jgi:hypothetical protein